MHPFFNYYWSCVRFNNKLIAWFVWRKVELDKINLCRIVDFDIVDYSKSSIYKLDHLIAQIKYHSYKLNCNYIDFFTTNKILIDRLIYNGFDDNDKYRFPNLVDPVEPRGDLNGEYRIALNNSNDYNICLYRGDGDQDRINESIWS